MIKYSEFYKMNNNEIINESSMSRLWRHNDNYDCAALTAFRVAPDCGDGNPYSKKKSNDTPCI